MANRAEIPLYNRQTQTLEFEQVFERGFMDFAYGHPLGRLFESALFSRKWFSKLYGHLKEQPGSQAQIQTFIQRYGLDISELEKPPEAYADYQAFFTRQLKPGARPIDPVPEHLVSPADARVLMLPLEEGVVVPVKGKRFALRDLLQNGSLAQTYAKGLCLIYRLAPVDYHHYCYIDRGWHRAHQRIAGALHSVSPLAQACRTVFPENERQWTLLHTEQFGPVLQIEVGALVVGRIQQLQSQGGKFERGQEKGWFALGGSTIIQLFLPGKVAIDPDICYYSAQAIETRVHQGSKVGKKN
ncbi:phosphatidylserine decarboxylase [bacterium (Candidatus Blackallbacteria) CG17_big_fil_post_rev_8_21_14_2_50_48_46]|uniref:Phosphatidylserine decarboxylase n=1 Tax=bacterium (Candidatus Blackallbacteria) CG17_big_fil_post_rev_8_21_14_2_50_48_46 TaxID=2014261 RepID=A0A2M7G979_9BACT|nr:MAG: phosphatidylserine decarboxylase [bacterium (Candidatus Blackallbacteria) CG18_big_fil_WC_8_21_14_2_50_49_26]PIW18668.1 MAG: phosphatidylserine decarboxylase [bacterium (Candidatus Blackallbacteria) CG17_big_fil_post_rev_8_21_14_2_50_48_46]PIW46346.1 MAG: phosphatidylserine decarboxylase [bacterium (Candidatus Blackallbacteria) CG13_big_fil_rev_8_21_14_2_50_49_14]